MYQNKRILAVVLARAGSKRLPNKNILELDGKPLVQWTLDAAENSKYIDNIIFTTDSEVFLDSVTVKKTIKQKRDSNLAKDNTKSMEVIFDSLSFFTKENQKPDYVIVLQPTSPLRTEEHIDEAIEYMFAKNADAITSVCQCEHSPLWANTLNEEKSMDNFLSDDLKTSKSQDLPTYYRLNGALSICEINKLYQEGSFFIKNNNVAYVMEQVDSVDIDTELDFLLAQSIINYKRKKL